MLEEHRTLHIYHIGGIHEDSIFKELTFNIVKHAILDAEELRFTPDGAFHILFDVMLSAVVLPFLKIGEDQLVLLLFS